jgi:hypothetical protein
MAINKIAIKVTGRFDEGRAGGAISPGHLIEKNSAGNVVVHATAGGGLVAGTERFIALEDGLIAKTVNDAYASGDLVPYCRVLAGDEVQVLLVGGANAAQDAALTSNGDGTFKVANGTTDLVLCKTIEALNLTALPAGLVRVSWAH